ncbi:Uncharacterized protein P5673_031442 [Acropora cervicornis]|uniref:DUF3504 domain-containing protein n=1 Tax=Acropora cervicornis TaxID=6130 RepID=A0AAD9USI3_ACRCE|nr:Uncharacterized protein P5673_031442 [Acropora cervicornis]
MEDQPTANYEALFVFAKGIKKKEEFSIEKIADYEYEVLGGTHVTLATKHLHEKFPGNPNDSGRVARIYIGLKDEEALWLGAMHNHTGSFRHQLTYRDEVEICCTQLFMAAQQDCTGDPPSPPDFWRDMCSSLLNKRKRNLSEVFTMAQLPGEGWKHFQTLSDLFEKAELKGQVAKPTDIVKKGKPVLRQWQLKPLRKLSSKDQIFLLEKKNCEIGAKNINTSKSTSFWLSVWKTWCEGKSIALEIEEHEPAELNRLLEKFYAEVKNKKGEDYEPDSLRVMIAAFDTHLKEKQYPLSIIKDQEFHSSKQVLEGKAKLLRQAGRGKRPNKARNLTKEEEELLWKENKFGSTTPEALVNTMWWLLTQHFGLRGRQEHHDMKVDDFQLCKDDNGVEFVQFTEGHECLPVGGERCPAALFKQFVSRRPQKLKTTGPFYLSIKTNRRPDDNVWFKVQPMGELKINDMMKSIVADTILESSDKKFTNHSARKTVVSKLKKVNLKRSGIVKVTGHKNFQSLDDYDEGK